ncbi:MAG: Ca-activated chloride channel [Acidobacteriota bacterium]|nr:Ca-activated chloride channel [Acidobacteriota bacterium]
MKPCLAAITNINMRAKRAHCSSACSSLSRLIFVIVFCVAFSFFIAPLHAQSGRIHPEPQASPSPGAQQRPRRATRETDAPPGEPSSSTAPSRTGSLPQTQSGPAQKNSNSKPQTDATPEIDDDEVYKVESNLVPVSASVTDALGHAVVDLKLEDFELRVDGQPKPISDISHAETPVRLALLFDNSSSIRPTRELEKQAAINFFRRVIRPSDQAAIFSISTVPSLDQPLTNDVSKLVRTIERYGEVEGSTSLFDTIVMAAEYLRPQPGRKVMIIVSDGVETTSNLEDYGEMVRRVLASDCQVFVIQTGLSDNANLRDLTAERRMQDLTSYTGGFVNVPKVPSDLEVAFAQIAADLAQQYVLSYYPNDDARDGRFRVFSLRVKSRGDVRVRARRGYYPRRRDNLSALSQGQQNSDMAASAPDFIRDPVASNPTPAQTRQVSSSARQSSSNANANANVNGPVVVASAPRHGGKNLDPDEDSSNDDGVAKPKPAVRFGTFIPLPDTPTPTQNANDSPPLKKIESPPAEPRTQTTSQPSQPEAAQTNTNQLALATSATTTPAQTNVATQPAQNNASTQTSTAQTSTLPSSAPPSSTAQGSSQTSRASSNSSPQPESLHAAQGESETAKKPAIVSGGVLNARARSLPVPVYPETAKRMRAAGTVVVEVTVDENGKVSEARAVSGPPLLRESAVVAARRAIFPPATIEGQPAQLKGVINYTFTF